MAEKGPLSGQTLGEKYLLGDLLGVGGFGAVYKGHHILLHRPQAIKVLLEHHFSKPKFRERFLREARTVAALDHPHIVHIDDFGMEEQERKAYLVMPFISEGTFHDLLKKQQSPLEIERVLYYLEQICSALDYAHQRGVVHLDLKPLNLLIHEDGRLLLSDFGLAHLLKQEALEGGTSLGFGTPRYMAPEHINGQPNTYSDVFSLGVILYQMLTGRLPFEGSQPVSVYINQLKEQPPPLRASRPELPFELEAVMVKVLAIQVMQRYQSAGELLAAFKGALTLAQERVRKAQEEQLRKAEEERARKAAAELAHKVEEERLRKAQEEHLRKVEKEQARKAEEERARKAAAELAHKAEEERVRKAAAEQAKKAEQERVPKAQMEQLRKVENEILRKAEEGARKATAEWARKAENERVRKAAEVQVQQSQQSPPSKESSQIGAAKTIIYLLNIISISIALSILLSSWFYLLLILLFIYIYALIAYDTVILGLKPRYEYYQSSLVLFAIGWGFVGWCLDPFISPMIHFLYLPHLLFLTTFLISLALNTLLIKVTSRPKRKKSAANLAK